MKIKDIIVESSNMASAEQIWDYVGGIHPKDQQGGGFLKRLIMRNPQYELKRVPLSSLHVPNDEDDGNDPYGRAMFVDVDHAREYSQHHVDKKPVVADAEGHILDGVHRAWAAAELLNRTDIMAWVPAEKLTESQSVKQEIEDFIDSLTPADVGVEEFPGYRVHFEGFTDECKSSSDYQKNPDKVYQQVYQDFIDREGGKKPAKSGMTGDEEYPILYSVFRVPQSKTVDTAERAYSIAYRKKQPWPRGSREEQLIRSEWQLSALYDQYVLKQGVADDEELPEGLLGNMLPWPEVVNKINSAMKAMGWKGQRKDDGSFIFTTRGAVTDEYYIVIIDNRGDSMFTYALGTVEEGDPHIGEQDTLPTTEASVSELMNAIRDGFGLNENFADGRNPGRKGLAKRSGVNTKASVSSLRKTAKNSSGEKQRMAHWLANMKAGRAKARRK